MNFDSGDTAVVALSGQTHEHQTSGVRIFAWLRRNTIWVANKKATSRVRTPLMLVGCGVRLEHEIITLSTLEHNLQVGQLADDARHSLTAEVVVSITAEDLHRTVVYKQKRHV